MERTKKQDKQSKSKIENSSNGNPLKRSIAGGLIVAAVGYLATKNRQKLLQMMSADKLKSTGSGVGQAAKEKSKEAVRSIKNSSRKIFNKKEDVSIEGYVNEQNETAGDETMIKPGIKKSSNKNNEESLNSENLRYQV